MDIHHEEREVTAVHLREQLQQRIDQVETRIRAACERAKRARDEITLVSVTKSATDEVLALLPEVGMFDLGENRPQELWRRKELLNESSQIRWHLIGHLQRNKIERTLPIAQLIHSVDSVRLLQSLERATMGRTSPLDVLLEFNTSAEASKLGFDPSEAMGIVEELCSLRQVRVMGLMTMAAPEEEAERCRPSFTRLRELRDQLAREVGKWHPMRFLSMGMSNDFEIAIEEGATHVRIGSALFAGLEVDAG